MEQQNGFIVPDDILEEADAGAATFNLLPAKSKEDIGTCWKNFVTG
jgi:hypothetical protein